MKSKSKQTFYIMLLIALCMIIFSIIVILVSPNRTNNHNSQKQQSCDIDSDNFPHCETLESSDDIINRLTANDQQDSSESNPNRQQQQQQQQNGAAPPKQPQQQKTAPKKPNQPPQTLAEIDSIINQEIILAQTQYFSNNCNKTIISYDNAENDIWKERENTWKKWNSRKLEDISNDHFDWWMFPWSLPSQHAYKYTIKYRNFKNLLLSKNQNSKRFVRDYVDGLERLIQAIIYVRKHDIQYCDPIMDADYRRKNKIFCSAIAFIAVSLSFFFCPFFFEKEHNTELCCDVLHNTCDSFENQAIEPVFSF